ncbi:hypothetical protein KDH_00290 [Dictyobacter sp. S3.2.2.5]|uniref:Flagellin N-terminal domain-containing protein n=1 Tax=Dictyobacter halimunensis TaxID=3026934 RepID=A0ABQ6FHW1_9CHLR|nr:hypothetical protein KDH_00040 [Dictyobacter sp. S3.2.2.5]GLV53174.1 hypothetical protein KDH_00290 [Dictyobacter sp. S3.2.2.5]
MQQTALYATRTVSLLQNVSTDPNAERSSRNGDTRESMSRIEATSKGFRAGREPHAENG